MDSLFQGVNLLCSVFVLALTILAVINFRKPRPFKPIVLVISITLIVLMLAVYIPISGIHLNFFLGFCVFLLGSIFGAVTGFSIRLQKEQGAVVGRNSRISFLLWAISLAFSMLMNLLPSVLASSLGALPLCLTSGMQVSGNLIILIRTQALNRQKAAAN